MKEIWHDFLLFKTPQILVVKHYERDFDMICHFKAAQNLAAEHYLRDFDMIFHYKEAPNLIAEQYVRDFLHDFLI